MTGSRGILGFVFRTLITLSLCSTLATAAYTPRALNESAVEELKQLLTQQANSTANPSSPADQLGLGGCLDAITALVSNPTALLSVTSLLPNLLGGAHAALGLRDVWAPEITEPDSETVWLAGELVTVTWDTSDPPQNPTGTKGKLLLGRLEDNGDDEDEHLDVAHPLAYGFDMTDGKVRVRVPNVEPGNDYIVVLIGDSGNRSPLFTIN